MWVLRTHENSLAMGQDHSIEMVSALVILSPIREEHSKR